jgi:hypothetical protein
VWHYREENVGQIKRSWEIWGVYWLVGWLVQFRIWPLMWTYGK